MFISKRIFEVKTQYNTDRCSFAMIIYFLIFDEFCDFLQLSFMPIEEKPIFMKIQSALKKWKIFDTVAKMIDKEDHYAGWDSFPPFF